MDFHSWYNGWYSAGLPKAQLVFACWRWWKRGWLPSIDYWYPMWEERVTGNKLVAKGPHQELCMPLVPGNLFKFQYSFRSNHLCHVLVRTYSTICQEECLKQGAVCSKSWRKYVWSQDARRILEHISSAPFLRKPQKIYVGRYTNDC
jgi:hypothetical protein